MNAPSRERAGRGSVARATASSVLVRVVILTSIWVVLTGGDSKGWIFAALVVALATLTSLRTVPPGSMRWRVTGLVRFIPFFLVYSVRGGIDVGSRALRRRPGLEPGIVDFRSRLPTSPALSFFAAVIGLQPGTLTARLEGDRLRVHVLDRRSPVYSQLRAIEARVADLFGVEMGPVPGDPPDASSVAR